MHRMSPSDYNRRIDELLSLLNLGIGRRTFPKLSGGMQRRLVVARAWFMIPDLVPG
jgi:ABC-type multidrug transport system ATPase subunit